MAHKFPIWLNYDWRKNFILEIPHHQIYSILSIQQRKSGRHFPLKTKYFRERTFIFADKRYPAAFLSSALTLSSERANVSILISHTLSDSINFKTNTTSGLGRKSNSLSSLRAFSVIPPLYFSCFWFKTESGSQIEFLSTVRCTTCTTFVIPLYVIICSSRLGRLAMENDVVYFWTASLQTYFLVNFLLLFVLLHCVSVHFICVFHKRVAGRFPHMFLNSYLYPAFSIHSLLFLLLIHTFSHTSIFFYCVNFQLRYSYMEKYIAVREKNNTRPRDSFEIWGSGCCP